MLLVDAQTNPTAIANTMNEFNCSTWVVTPEAVDILEPLKKERADVATIEMPSLDHWLADGEFSVYPYTKSWEDAKFDPIFGLYTSGSTGMRGLSGPNLCSPVHC